MRTCISFHHKPSHFIYYPSDVTVLLKLRNMFQSCTSHTRPLWILVYMRQTTSNCGVYSRTVLVFTVQSRSIGMTGTDDSRSSISLNSSSESSSFDGDDCKNKLDKDDACTYKIYTCINSRLYVDNNYSHDKQQILPSTPAIYTCTVDQFSSGHLKYTSYIQPCFRSHYCSDSMITVIGYTTELSFCLSSHAFLHPLLWLRQCCHHADKRHTNLRLISPRTLGGECYCSVSSRGRESGGLHQTAFPLSSPRAHVCNSRQGMYSMVIKETHRTFMVVHGACRSNASML